MKTEAEHMWEWYRANYPKLEEENARLSKEVEGYAEMDAENVALRAEVESLQRFKQKAEFFSRQITDAVEEQARLKDMVESYRLTLANLFSKWESVDYWINFKKLREENPEHCLIEMDELIQEARAALGEK